MRKEFLNPEIEILELQICDVITTSIVNISLDEDETPAVNIN